MSFNSMRNLGSDMILGDVVAKNITCQTITIENSEEEDLKAKSLEADVVTANEKLLVSNNAMIINNTHIDSSTPLLGNPGSSSVGQYLTKVYPDSTATYTVEQLAAGDDGSQSLIFTAGGGFSDSVRSTIQSYDSYRSNEANLWLNPLGGDVKVGVTLSAPTANFDEVNVRGTGNFDEVNVTGTGNFDEVNVTGTSNFDEVNVTGTGNFDEVNVTGTGNFDVINVQIFKVHHLMILQ